jgi:hypothetical protein
MSVEGDHGAGGFLGLDEEIFGEGAADALGFEQFN